jgi:hypothetical protein
MLNNYLNLWPAIEVTINRSSAEYFKKNKAILTFSARELNYLENCSKIFSIFIKPTIKLQAEKYPTIYYLLPEIYKLYIKLEALKGEINISFYNYLFTLLLSIYFTIIYLLYYYLFTLLLSIYFTIIYLLYYYISNKLIII